MAGARYLANCLFADIMNDEELLERIARCRRLAASMTDDEVRHSLEDLADAYEAQLASCHRPFMLGGSASGPGSASR